MHLRRVSWERYQQEGALDIVASKKVIITETSEALLLPLVAGGDCSHHHNKCLAQNPTRTTESSKAVDETNTGLENCTINVNQQMTNKNRLNPSASLYTGNLCATEATVLSW